MRKYKSSWTPPTQRKEQALTVGIVFLVVVATVFGIWLLRPGGWADRQARVAWFVLGNLVALSLVVWLLARVMNLRKHSVRRLIIALVIVAVGGSAAGYLWPGGLWKNYPDVPDLPELPGTPEPLDGVPSTTPALPPSPEPAP